MTRLPNLAAIAPLLGVLAADNQVRRVGRDTKARARVVGWSKDNAGARNAITSRRRAALLQRTPPWADLGAIRAIYERAALVGDHVDHIVPLQGELVSGLHVANNLQLLTPDENYRKSNKMVSTS